MSPRNSLGAAALPFVVPCLALGLQAGCAKPAPPAPLTAAEPNPLEGDWEADDESGPVQMTIAGDSLYFYARPDFQYDALFTLAPDLDPPELHATILDSPRTTDGAGEHVLAIYELVEDTLNIAVVEKSDGVRPSFDGATARYRFEKVPKRE
jgi:hypothetical protein